MPKLFTKELGETVRLLGTVAAARGDKESPSSDWALLKLWDADKPTTDKEYNWLIYQAWLEGFREKMQELIECLHCGHRVPALESTFRKDCCDLCYVRHYAPDSVIRECIAALQAKRLEEKKE